MNWYKQHKESMALPEIKNQYPEPYKRGYGLDYLDSHLSDEKAKELSEPQMGYLGSGYYGTAFGFEGTNIVKKYTRGSEEAAVAREIMRRQNGDQPLPGLVYVYDVKDLSADVFDYVKLKEDASYETLGGNLLFEITTEKVNIPSKEEREFFWGFYQSVIELRFEFPRITDEDLLTKLKKKYGVASEFDNFIKSIIKLKNTVIKNGYRDIDFHGENVGFRIGTDELVVLDLGAIRFSN